MCHREVLFVVTGFRKLKMPEMCVQTNFRTAFTAANNTRTSLDVHGSISSKQTYTVTRIPEVKLYQNIKSRSSGHFTELPVTDINRNHSGGRYLVCTGFQLFHAVNVLAASEGRNFLYAPVFYDGFRCHYDAELKRRYSVKGQFQQTDGLCFSNENFSLLPTETNASDGAQTSNPLWTILDSTKRKIVDTFLRFSGLDHTDDTIVMLSTENTGLSYYKSHHQEGSHGVTTVNTKFLCRIILNYMNSSQLFISICSRTAQRCYALEGRGGIILSFKVQTVKEDLMLCFMEGVNVSLAYIHFDLLRDVASESQNLESLQKFEQFCKQYNPEQSYIFAVNINGHFETCCKSMRCQKEILINDGSERLIRFRTNFLCYLLRLLEISLEPKDPQSTLILTPLPGTGSEANRRAREICFTHIQQKLRERGIILRHQFPEIHRRLCAFAEKNAEFAPVCLYPVNQKTGKGFYCAIMPNSEPAHTSLKVYTSRVRREVIV